MAYPYTRSRARSEVPDSDIEPSDTAPSAATSPLPPSIFVGPNVDAVEGSESVSTESAGPVSVPTLSLPVGGPPSSGIHGVVGSAGPSHVGSPPWGTPAVKQTGGQMSTSLATGIARAEVHAQLEKSSPPTSTSRQPPPAAAAETAAAEGRTVASKEICYRKES